MAYLNHILPSEDIDEYHFLFFSVICEYSQFFYIIKGKLCGGLKVLIKFLFSCVKILLYSSTALCPFVRILFAPLEN